MTNTLTEPGDLQHTPLINQCDRQGQVGTIQAVCSVGVKVTAHSKAWSVLGSPLTQGLRVSRGNSHKVKLSSISHMYRPTKHLLAGSSSTMQPQ